MKFVEMGMGLYGWHNNNIGIYGGMRAAGFHKAGHQRTNFVIFDTAHKIATGEDKEIGKLELTIKFAENEGEAPTITNVINLEIKKDFRKQGYGKKTVEALLECVSEDLRICDIKPAAKKFWQKAGIEEFKKDGRYTEGFIKKTKPENVNAPKISM